MKKVIFFLVTSIFLTNISAQSIFEKAAKEAQKLLNKEIEKRKMEMTGEGAPLVTSLDEARNALLNEVWMYGDQEARTANILRFNIDGNYEKTMGKEDSGASVTSGKWEVKFDVVNVQYYVELDSSEKLIFQNSRQLLLGDKLYRKTPSYIMK